MRPRKPGRWPTLLALLAAPCWAQAQALPLDEVMAALARAPERRAGFAEDKTFAALSRPLHSEGQLAFRKPDHLEKVTTAPQAERFVVDGDQIVIDAGNDAPRVLELDNQPGLRALIDTIRGTLSGDLALLRRSYDVSGSGTAADWRIALRPRDPALARTIKQVDLAGGSELRTIETVSPNGDTDTLTITPVP